MMPDPLPKLVSASKVVAPRLIALFVVRIAPPTFVPLGPAVVVRPPVKVTVSPAPPNVTAPLLRNEVAVSIVVVVPRSDTA